MGCMLDSDWSRKILLRCDWLGLLVASITTLDAHSLKFKRSEISFEKGFEENVTKSV